jgi:hypothetical protein
MKFTPPDCGTSSAATNVCDAILFAVANHYLLLELASSAGIESRESRRVNAVGGWCGRDKKGRVDGTYLAG